MENLNSYLISAPLAAFVTWLTGISLLIVFDAAGIAIFKRKELWARALYFFSGLLIFVNLLLLLPLLHLATQPVYRTIAGTIIITGIILLPRQAALKDFVVFSPFNSDNTIGKLTKYILLLTLGAYFLISSTPPTDADSLDYHLGVPVEILNNNSILLNPDNLHFRLFGFGELLNTFGLAIGCAQFGAFIQFLALCWMLLVVTSSVQKDKQFQITSICLSIPILLFLIATQKHQLTGIAATTVCFYAFCFKYKDIDKRLCWVFAGTLLFAIGIKYSFIISGSILALFFIYRTHEKVTFTFRLITVFILFLLPLFTIKYFIYKDPLSPILSGYLSDDKVVIDFYKALKTTTDNKLPFPINFFIPSSIGFLSAIMGVSALIIIVPLRFIKQHGTGVSMIILLTLLSVLFGQHTARFFLESFYWSATLIVMINSNSKWVSYISTIAQIQFLILLPVVVIAAVHLSKGIVTNNGRHQVMNAYATGYAESRWIDSMLPQDVVICTDVRSRSLLPRRYFPLEYLNADTVTLKNMLQKYGVAYLILADKPPEKTKSITFFKGEEIASRDFTKGTRNPANNTRYRLRIYRVRSL